MPKGRDEIRVFVIGGSAVFNGSPLPKSIPGQIERIARGDGHGTVRAYNWGVVSAVSDQELSLIAHRVVDYQPDVVVVYDGANDIVAPHSYDPRPGYPYNFLLYEEALKAVEGRLSIPDMLRRASLRSYAFRAIFGRYLGELFTNINTLRAENGYRTPLWNQRIREEYIRNIEKMCRLSQGFGFRLAVFLQPLVYFKTPLLERERDLYTKSEYTEDIRSQYRATSAGLDQLKQKYVHTSVIIEDLSRIFDNYEKEIFWDFVHTNNEGNEFIARTIYRYLKDGGLFARRGSHA